MSTLIHADVFFFVTTFAVIAVAIALTVALIYLAKALSDIKEITGQLKEETRLFRSDIADLRAGVRKEGFRLEAIFGFLKSIARRTGFTTKRSVAKEAKEAKKRGR